MSDSLQRMKALLSRQRNVRLNLFVVLLLMFAFTGCQSVFFFPEKGLRTTPASLSLPFEELSIPTRDGLKLYGWFLPATRERRGSILVLHGNAENISTHFHSVAWLPAKGYDVLALDYRGYGLSEGEPSVAGMVEDTRAALDYLATRSEGPLILYGQSLGGAIAVAFAANYSTQPRLKALIVEASFSSYRRIAREKLAALWLTWPLQYPLSWFISDSHSPDEVVGKLSALPILFVHGTADEIVPEHHSDILYSLAHEPKQLWKVPGAGHTQAFFTEEWRERLLEYLASGQSRLAKDH